MRGKEGKGDSGTRESEKEKNMYRQADSRGRRREKKITRETF